MPELNTAPLGDLFLGAHDKTLFSMVIPPVTALLKKHDFKSIVLLGIEVGFVNECGGGPTARSSLEQNADSDDDLSMTQPYLASVT